MLRKKFSVLLKKYTFNVLETNYKWFAVPKSSRYHNIIKLLFY